MGGGKIQSVFYYKAEGREAMHFSQQLDDDGVAWKQTECVHIDQRIKYSVYTPPLAVYSHPPPLLPTGSSPLTEEPHTLEPCSLLVSRVIRSQADGFRY